MTEKEKTTLTEAEIIESSYVSLKLALAVLSQLGEALDLDLTNPRHETVLAYEASEGKFSDLYNAAMRFFWEAEDTLVSGL